MNRNLISTFALALAVVMSGCTEALPTTTDVEATSEGLEALFSGEARAAVEGGLSSHFGTTNPEAFSKGAMCIVPFSTGLTWGIGVFTPGSPPTLESAGFGAELDQGDFYRENNDGTVSVHVASNNAEATYVENLFDPTSLSLSGTGAQFSANYTGTVVEIPIPGGVIRFIDLAIVERAVSIRGNGWMQDEEWNVYKMSLAIGQTPSGNVNRSFCVTARKWYSIEDR